MYTGAVFLSDSESFKYQIIMKYITGKIYRDEAATLLKSSERTISRLSKKVKAKGYLGVKNGNFGRASNRRTPDDIKEYILKLKKEQYYDFNCTHFHEILVKQYSLNVGYTTLWGCLEKKI